MPDLDEPMLLQDSVTAKTFNSATTKELEDVSDEDDLAMLAFPKAKFEEWHEMLPTWAFDQHVCTTAKAIYKKGIFEAFPLQCAVGPAVLIALYCSFATWGLFAIMPWVAGHFSTCAAPEEQDSHTMRSTASYNGILVWSIAGPTLLLFLALEFRCFRYAIIPQLQVSGVFKILWKEVRFPVWFCFNMLVSLATHTDLVTNGIFLALAFKMQSCGALSSKINCIWAEVTSQSILGYIPGFVYVIPRFHKLVFVFWLLIFVQGFYGWLGSLPLSLVRKWTDRIGGRMQKAFKWIVKKRDLNVEMLKDNFLPDYEPQSWGKVVEFAEGGEGEGTNYLTFLDQGQFSRSDHGSGLLLLADTTRMCSITAMRTNYHRRKVRYYLAQQNDGPAFGLMQRMLITFTHKLVLLGIIQNGIQLMLQVTQFAMTTALKKHGVIDGRLGVATGITFVNFQMFFSIIIGLLNFWKNAYDALCVFWWVEETLEKARWDAPRTEKRRSYQKLDLKGFHKRILAKLRRLRIALVIYSVMGVYTICKLVAVFECDSCMFSMPRCPEIHSCCFQNDATEVCWMSK